MTTFLSFAFVLGVLVFVHEMGHYLAARWRGVHVDAFSIGFGRPLLRWSDRHGTEWRLGWVPLGGYVKLHGQEVAGDVPPEVRAGWRRGQTFHEKSVGSRAIVVAAGPIANFLLAILLFAGVFATLGKPVGNTTVGVVIENSAAAGAGLRAGDEIVAGERVDVKPGNAMPMRSMPIGTIIHNIEMKPGKGGQMARSAGTYAQLVGRDAGYAQIRLGSGELRMVLDSCMATVGAVSNPDHMNESLGKAGRVRHMGRRPHVRGVAMNPVDHPHGGGEGKTSGGRHPVTPWGKPTKGKKTRSNKRTDSFIVSSRHARKK